MTDAKTTEEGGSTGSTILAIIGGLVTIAAVLIPWLIKRNDEKEQRRRETRAREEENERTDTDETRRLRDEARRRSENRDRQRDASDGWEPE